jgi:diaminopimelate epimerase
MHGIGNDFILIDCINQEWLQPCSDLFWVDFSIKYCERRKRIGADQLLLLLPSNIGDYRMRIFNSGGGEVEMCGNGIRCLAKYIWDNNLSKKDMLEIETLAGIIRPLSFGDLIKVDMGQPKLEGGLNDEPINILDKTFNITTVSMGNPHAVIVVDDVESFPVEKYGQMIETNATFPNRTNVEFIEIIDKQTIKMRVWERGAGETLACGTGACAAAVVSYLYRHTGSIVKVILSGGELDIDWTGMRNIYMTGPAITVFKGSIEI